MKLIARILLISILGALAPGIVSAESVFGTGKAKQLSPAMEHPVPRGLSIAEGVRFEDAEASADAPASSVSQLKAAASSLLLPGLGQQKLGHRLSSKVYFTLEGLSWTAVASFIWIGYSREQAYKDYAAAYAGVSGTDHSDEFYERIGQYMSNDGPGGYNEAVRRDARDLYYPDVGAMDSYYESRRITGDDGWQWRTERSYYRYGTLRDGSRFAYRVALYAAVCVGALRIVSAADAVRLARTASPSKEGGTVSLGLQAGPQGPSLYVQKSF